MRLGYHHHRRHRHNYIRLNFYYHKAQQCSKQRQVG